MRTRLVEYLRAGLPDVEVDWGETPQGLGLPAVVLVLISDVALYDLDGADDLVRARVQVDVFADSYNACADLTGQVWGLLSGWQEQPLIKGCFIDTVRDMPAENAGSQRVARTATDITLTYERI